MGSWATRANGLKERRWTAHEKRKTCQEKVETGRRKKESAREEIWILIRFFIFKKDKKSNRLLEIPNRVKKF